MARCCSRAILTVLLAVFATTVAAQVPAQAGPLRLVLECSQASELTFRFTVQNVSAAPTAAVIGTILGNDQKYLPDHLEMTVRRAGVSDTNLKYSVGGVVGGRLDPWLVALPAGASYSVAVPARYFRLGTRLAQEPFVVPAELQLRLTTREVGKPQNDLQGLSFIHVWVGTLTSDWIQFPKDCRPG